ncbi:hypothetical protein G6F35_012541 [Rhizopus arrhizus]|nr:hypothetical protein G6F35_012541 [Rhizopus arrhizus]KAG1222474.1 hypothetical protein G6F68_020631 [Rhizopus microsporus]KAG1250941.1 hypothetical protein G6F65_018547 [Rhizopus arrhizus]
MPSASSSSYRTSAPTPCGAAIASPTRAGMRKAWWPSPTWATSGDATTGRPSTTSASSCRAAHWMRFLPRRRARAYQDSIA